MSTSHGKPINCRLILWLHNRLIHNTWNVQDWAKWLTSSIVLYYPELQKKINL